MSKIRIRNFGPIKKGCLSNDGWIEIKKVTVFIGNQGSGKSTVAKLISTFTWIEKTLVRGDFEKSWFKEKDRLKNQYLNYHRLENYFIEIDGIEKTEIEYKGDAYHFKYKDGNLSIIENAHENYPLPQIMYVPAERNFITYVSSPKELKLSSDSLKEFLTEYDYAKNEINDAFSLPINDTDIEYDKLKDSINLKGKDYKLKLTEASSGFQSFVPLHLVSFYLANSVRKQSKNNKETMSSEEINRFKKGVEEIWSNENLTAEQKRAAISVLSSKFNKTAFVNIVEEPEQNLFPSSQRKMLNSLLEFNNINKGNKLIITTHSPYIITYLSLSIQGNYLQSKIINSTNNANELKKIYEIIPEKSMVMDSDVVIYQLDEIDGSIKQLKDYDGIPSDQNFLNNSLNEGNILFDSLLEIEQGL